MSSTINFNGEVELSEEVLDAIAERVAERLGGDTPAKAGKGKGNKANEKAPAKGRRRGKKDDDEGIDEEAKSEFEDGFADATEGEKAKDIKAFLGGFNYKSVGHVDPKDYDEVLTAAQDEFGQEEEAEITVDSVKAKCQKLTKLDKDAMSEVFEDFEIKSTRSLGKLSEEDLEDMDLALTEALEDVI